MKTLFINLMSQSIHMHKHWEIALTSLSTSDRTDKYTMCLILALDNFQAQTTSLRDCETWHVKAAKNTKLNQNDWNSLVSFVCWESLLHRYKFKISVKSVKPFGCTK